MKKKQEISNLLKKLGIAENLNHSGLMKELFNKYNLLFSSFESACTLQETHKLDESNCNFKVIYHEQCPSYNDYVVFKWKVLEYAVEVMDKQKNLKKCKLQEFKDVLELTLKKECTELNTIKLSSEYLDVVLKEPRVDVLVEMLNKVKEILNK